VVVTGGHTCPGNPERELRELLSETGASQRIKLDFRFIGVDVPIEERDELTEIATAFGGKSVFPEDEDQLESALKTVVSDEPLVRHDVGGPQTRRRFRRGPKRIR
jgi:hypothetical protein